MKYYGVVFDWGDTLAPLDDRGVPQVHRNQFWVYQLIKKLYHGCYRLGIISNSYRYQDGWWIRNELAQEGMLQYFEFVISSATAGLHKPDPGIFKMAEQFLRINPKHILMVGDSERCDGGATAMGWDYLKVSPGSNWSSSFYEKLEDDFPAKRKLSNVFEVCGEFPTDTFTVPLRRLSCALLVGERIVVYNKEYEITSLSRPVSATDVLSSNEKVTIGIKELP